MLHSRNVRFSPRKSSALLAACAAVLNLTSVVVAAQGPPAHAVIQMQHGRPFEGDVRQLRSNLPPQREFRPDHREEPPLVSAGGVPDAVAQTIAPSLPAPPPGSGGGAGTFAGLDFANFGDGWPPDTNGDVGPTFYIQTVNTSIGIFNKSDGARVAAFSFDALMSQGRFGNPCDSQNAGDPVVVWDSSADRWVISDFAFAFDAQGNPVAPFFECLAVSRSGDPVSGGWNFYSIQTTDLFPDYPKMGVWPDALYLTANMFRGNGFSNVRVWALNKSQMYAGAPASVVVFNLPASVQGVSVFTALPSTYHTATGVPPAGRPNLISVIWSAKAARIWKFHVDWNNTANSSLTGPSTVNLATWGVAPDTVAVKNGNALDTLRERLMVQSQYTNQGGVESLWLTHTVANPGNASLGAPRWYQLNVTGGAVGAAPLQQSTWAPDGSVSRWMPSLAVDKNGNVAVGYTAASSALFPAIRYAGRLASDAGSTLGQTETSLVEGGASQCCTFSDGSSNSRWGDYSAMTIDPDGCTFWYTSEFYQSPQPTVLAADNWQTRIGSFKYSGCSTNSGAIQGTVTDAATNAPIVGATVSAGVVSTSTDANGFYSLTGLAAGTYTVAAAATGFNGLTAQVTLAADQTIAQNFALTASVAPGASPDGTTVPPAGQIIDDTGAVWTIGGGQAILRSGAQAAGGRGSQILWKNTTIFVFGTDGNWYRWTGSSWINVGPIQPGGGTASPDGTTVPPATQIVDSTNAIWTIGANQAILRNGASAAGGLGSKILWKSGTIFVFGTDNNWYQWTGSAWVNVGPIQPGGAASSPDGTTVPPSGQIVDDTGAVWTIGPNQSILRNGASAAGGLGSQILWKTNTIFVFGIDNNWYRWNGAGWVNLGPAHP